MGGRKCCQCSFQNGAISRTNTVHILFCSRKVTHCPERFSHTKAFSRITIAALDDIPHALPTGCRMNPTRMTMAHRGATSAPLPEQRTR